MINATESDGNKAPDNRHFLQQGSEFGRRSDLLNHYLSQITVYIVSMIVVWK